MINKNEVAEFVGQIIDGLEDFLEEKKIVLYNPEKDEDNDAANIYGSDYGYLQQGIEETLKNWGLISEEEPWATEAWYDEDIENALELNQIEVSKKNIAKVRESAIHLFDDKSSRNEMLSDLVTQLFEEEKMIVKTKSLAQLEVKKLIGSDWIETKSNKGEFWGRTEKGTVRFYKDGSALVCLYNSDNDTIEIKIDPPRSIEEYAEFESLTITHRRYEQNSSQDVLTKSTEEERKILQGILTGALHAVQAGNLKQTVMDTAEYIATNLLPGMNGYDSVYNKIRYCPFLDEKE